MGKAITTAGVPEGTLRRAKKELPAGSHQVQCADERAWYWYDPAAPRPADAPFEPSLPDVADLLPGRWRR